MTPARIPLSLLSAVLLSSSALIAADSPGPGVPQTVHLMRRSGQRPWAWYTEQAELWQQQIRKTPADADAWKSYYLATEYRDRFRSQVGEEADSAQVDLLPGKDETSSTLLSILDQMEDAVPGSYQLPYLRARLAGLGDPRQRDEFIARAYERCPECPDVLEDLAMDREIAGQHQGAREAWTGLYRSGALASGLLDYNYNVLESTDEGAILLTNGDNDTFPAWILQRVHGVREDVLVLNLSLMHSCRDYVNRELAHREVDVDVRKLPREGGGALVTAFCEAVSRARPDIPIFVASTVAEDHIRGIEDKLQICGLASRYAPDPIDHIARIRRNLNHRFRMDYLTFDWYSESHISTGPIVRRLNANYTFPFMALSEYAEAEGDTSRARHWRRRALEVAERTGDRQLREYLWNRLKGEQ